MISKEYLDKFKKLYKDKYDITLTDEETTELATHFLNLMEILIRPKNKSTVVDQPEEGHVSETERRDYATGRI
jgi:hypothetical protein